MTPEIHTPPRTHASPVAASLDRFRYTRRPTRVVHVGEIPVGGLEPIRIQSMTTSYTWDVEKTVGQIESLVNVGCEIVRLTVPTKQDAEALPAIRELDEEAQDQVPSRRRHSLLAPRSPCSPSSTWKKIRMNPGNFSDGTRSSRSKEYTDEAYNGELARMEKLSFPWSSEPRQRGISMRIGTNHGSLSDGIVNRFGDSPAGMVESALEFVRICERLDYRDLIISMKASNTLVMVQAYRLCAARMTEEGMDYPFHVGVTEAGDGDDGRIKSAIGIGSLLEDGIGDTIRVSLTEDSTKEIPAGLRHGQEILRALGPAPRGERSRNSEIRQSDRSFAHGESRSVPVPAPEDSPHRARSEVSRPWAAISRCESSSTSARSTRPTSRRSPTSRPAVRPRRG